MAESQEILFVVKADNKQAVDALNKVQASMQGVTTKTKTLAGATQNSNMMLMSTGRIVQDLPYGLMGIGNNITFLAEQLGQAKTQGISFKDSLKGMGAALLGPGGLIFGISTAVTVLTMLSNSTDDTKGKIKSLTETLKDHWSETYKARKEWEKFQEELKKFSIDDLGESLRAVNLQIKQVGLSLWEGGLYALGFRGKIKEIFAELSKLKTEQSMILGNFITNTYDPDKTIDKVKDLLKEEQKVIDEIKRLKGQDASYRFRMGGDASKRGGAGMGGQTLGVGSGLDRGGITQAGMAMFTKDFENTIKMVTALTVSSADILRSEFMQAWEDIFGEANSLFEKLIANFVNQLMNLGLQQLAGGFLNFLFPGAGMAFGALAGSPQIINVQLGDETLARAVVKGNNTAQRLRLN